MHSLREELIQTAAVCVSIIEDLDHGVAHLGGPGANREWLVTQAEPILDQIHDERKRQEEKWGPQHHTIHEWLVILGEEYGEACQAALDEYGLS